MKSQVLRQSCSSCNVISGRTSCATSCEKNKWSILKFSCRTATHLVSCASWNSSERLLSSAALISCLSCFSVHLSRSTSCVRLFKSVWACIRLLDSWSPCIRRFFTWSGRTRERWDITDVRQTSAVFDKWPLYPEDTIIWQVVGEGH